MKVNLSHSEAFPAGHVVIDSGKSATELVHADGRTAGFSWIAGKGVILTAPHAVQHLRDGESKQAEPNTEFLAAGLAMAVGGSAVWSTTGIHGDPNWDDDHPFKLKAVDLVDKGEHALDLHIMRDRGFDVCLGLGVQRPIDRSLWMLCAEEFVEAGYTVSINYPFSAGPRTVTSHLQREGVRAIQIEMTWDICRADGRGAETAEVLLRICKALYK